MQVQSTNDSSIVSKLSSSERGYFEDKWLNMFVKKAQRRSPIINRGYYIRFKAIEAAFQSWFESLSSSKKEKSQIISLGAGFDTSYFRLKSSSQILTEFKYIEVDYPEVMRRKFQCIQNAKSNYLQEPNPDEIVKYPNLVASNGEYTLLGLDLKNYEELGNSFKALQIDFSIPTLFLSECAITYMDVKSSNGLIEWIQSHFPNSAFVTYEQVNPSDGFGIVMQNHFTSLACPLKSLPSYPDKDSQYFRFIKMGWTSCSSISMYDFFTNFKEDEICRIQDLEMFDEYEMWQEKCHHYLLIWACQGTVALPEKFLKKSYPRSYEDNLYSQIDWEHLEVPLLLQRFGHQVALLSSRFLLLSGGFGQLEKRHQRLNGLAFYDIELKSCGTALLLDPLNSLGQRMFHSMTLLSNDNLVILGGRSSPRKVFNKVVTAQCDNMPTLISKTIASHGTKLTFTIAEKTDMPLPTWRHSASSVEIEGIETIVLFGGCSSVDNATNNCYLLNTKTWNWSKVPQQPDTPLARHSHSSVSIDKNKVVITCGLTRNELILNSVHLLDCLCSKWSTLVIPGLLPRYSHTSHFWNNSIFLVGGITNISGHSLGIGIINLDTLTVKEFSCPAQEPEYPILLSNHCSYIYEDKIVISGGGGNCFSFGTHFNKKDVHIDLKKIL